MGRELLLLSPSRVLKLSLTGLGMPHAMHPQDPVAES